MNSKNINTPTVLSSDKVLVETCTVKCSLEMLYSVDMNELLLATRSQGKLREISAALHDVPYALIGLADIETVPKDFEPEEPAATFEGNALIKAMTYGTMTGKLTLAEDAGLIVDALGGRPGVLSARYAPGTDKDRYMKLLSELEGVPEESRTARFVAVYALFDPSNLRVRTCEGQSEGVITTEPIGENGFGYDPIFRYAATGKTGGEMGREEKNAVSHRGAALVKVRELLATDFSTLT